MQKLDFQLKDFYMGAAINATGGKSYITPAGKYVKAILRNASGAQIANAASLTRGHLSAYVDNVVWAQLAWDGQTANFTVGQVVTGAQSGATGIIKAQTDAGATGTLTMVGVTGVFADDEAITDPLGGAAVVNGALSAQIYNVDIYTMGPNGQFVVRGNVDPKQIGEIFVNQADRNQVFVCPFSIYDSAAATETDTGFDEPTGGLWLPTPAIYIGTTDAAITIEVGTDGSGSNDPDGFIDAVSTATAGVNTALIKNGADTMGDLFDEQDSANAGDLVPCATKSTGDSITWTLLVAADTAEGLIILPYVLAGLPVTY